MNTELFVALISAGAVVLAAALGAIGARIGTSRTRLPLQLRQAKYLADELEAMAAGSAEQVLARNVHDDLVVDWALTEADHSYDELIAYGRPVVIVGVIMSLVGLVGIFATAVASVWEAPSDTASVPPSGWMADAGASSAILILVGVSVLLIGGLLYLLGRRGHSRNVTAIRRAHNLRDSVRTVNDTAMKAYRSERWAAWLQKLPKRKPNQPPPAPESS